MKKTFAICLLLCWLCPIEAFCQKIEVVLTKTFGEIPKSRSRIQVSDDDSGKLAVPEGIKFKTINYYRTPIAPIEEAFRRYKSGMINYADFLVRVKNINRYAIIDTNLLSKNLQRFPSSTIHFISGIDDVGNKVILVDANQDGVITPNEIFSFPPSVVEKATAELVPADFGSVLLQQKATDGTRRSINVKIIPVPLGTRNAAFAFKTTTDFCLLRDEFWSGTVAIQGQNLTLYAQSRTFFNEQNNMQFRIDCNGKYDSNFFNEDDTWFNDLLSLEVDSVKTVNGDNQKMKTFISYQSPPRKAFDTTFVMSLQNVASNKVETLHPFLNQHKYILLDYWGTWCVPCVEKLPQLKDIRKRFSDKLSVISIAYDEDIRTVSSFNKAHDVDWDNYYINRNLPRNLTSPLRVVQYPTYRLYDENGKLLFAGDRYPDTALDMIAGILSGK